MTTNTDYQEARERLYARLELLDSYNAFRADRGLSRIEGEMSFPIRSVRLLLSGPPEPTEPVAWRWRTDDMSDGFWIAHAYKPTFVPGVVAEVQPLYASPAPSAQPVTAEEPTEEDVVIAIQHVLDGWDAIPVGYIKPLSSDLTDAFFALLSKGTR